MKALQILISLIAILATCGLIYAVLPKESLVCYPLEDGVEINQ